MEKISMSKSGSRLAIIGPIVGFVLVYFIVGAAVDQLHADQETFKEYGVATVQDVQLSGVEDHEAAETVGAETPGTDQESVMVDAATDDEEDITAEAGAEEIDVEEAAAEEAAAEEAAAEEAAVEEAAVEEAAVEEAAVEEAVVEEAVVEEAIVEEAATEADVSAVDSVTEVAEESDEESVAPADSEAAGMGGQGQRGQGLGGQGRGGGSEMQARHRAPIPDEYAGLADPIAADAESLARGAEHFELFCATCHGSEGLGDGPASAGLDPAPPMIAQTSLMTGDDYLFWRISEGGAFDPFNSAMPAWKEILDEAGALGHDQLRALPGWHEWRRQYHA
jgi:mono/diheme cytochrome c family protein